MMNPQTTIERLKNIKSYLDSFHKSQRSTNFEELIAQTLSDIFHLPYYTCDNDDASKEYRVTWLGSKKGPTKAPPGPDAVVRAYGFYVLIEATLKDTSRQWEQEFGRALEHLENFVRQEEVSRTYVYSILIMPKLHNLTYRSMRGIGENLIPLETDILHRLLRTSNLAFSIKHLALRYLFNDLKECLSKSSFIENFRSNVDSQISEWQKKVLEEEKYTFLAVRSYQAMRKIRSVPIGTSQILRRLQKDPVVKEYTSIIKGGVEPDRLADSLVYTGLVCRHSRVGSGEVTFEPVPQIDFKGRIERVIEAVEKII